MPITYEFIQLWIIQNGHRDFAQDRKSFHSEFFSGFLLVGLLAVVCVVFQVSGLSQDLPKLFDSRMRVFFQPCK